MVDTNKVLIGIALIIFIYILLQNSGALSQVPSPGEALVNASKVVY